MANYLPGAPQDYIPHIQPFRPDLNFYQAALEKKESQYKQGYDQLSSVYGSLLNSAMLNDDNNTRRDEFFKQAETNIQKMSKLDLSLEENVDAAYKTFQPLIDDKYIMKDMGFTKSYHGELNRAEGFRNCLDEKKCGGKWWKPGVDALHYYAEDFKNASHDDSLQFDQPKFVPGFNGIEKVMANVKEMGFNVTESASDGKYIHTYKNGALMTMPLYEYMKSIIGNNPQAMEAYTTQGYVDRKEFMKGYAAQYGSEDAAESVYINQILSEVDKTAAAGKTKADANIKLLTAKQGVLTDKVKSGSSEDERALILEAQGITDQLDKANGVKKVYDDASSYTDQASLLGADKKTLRWRADRAAAVGLLNNDMYKAAAEYSALNYEHTQTVDGYGLAAFNHAFEWEKMIEEARLKGLSDTQKHIWDMEKIAAKAEANGRSADPNDRLPTVITEPILGTTKDKTNPNKEGVEEAKATTENATRNAIVDYNKLVYDSYKFDLSSNDPNVVTIAKEALKYTFGKLLDKDYNLTDGALSRDADYVTTYQKAKLEVKQNKLTDDRLYKQMQEKEPGITKLINEWGVAKRVDERNNVNIKDYVTGIMQETENYTAQDKKDIGKMFTADGKQLVTEDTFVKSYLKTHTDTEYVSKLIKKGVTFMDIGKVGDTETRLENRVEEAKDKYAEYQKLYKTTYNADAIPGLKPVKPYDASVNLGGAGGGATANSYSYPVDAANWKDPGANGLVSLYKNIQKIGNKAQLDYPADSEKNDPAIDMAMAYMADNANNSYSRKGADAHKRPTGKIKYIDLDVTKEDPTAYTNYFVTMDAAWVFANQGTAKKKGPAFGFTGAQTVKITIPKDLADNAFRKAVIQKPIDIQLEHEPVVISNTAGQLTVTKTTDGFDVIGGYYYYNALGQLQYNSEPYHYPNSNLMSGSDLVEGLEADMKAREAINKRTSSQIAADRKATNPNLPTEAQIPKTHLTEAFQQ